MGDVIKSFYNNNTKILNILIAILLGLVFLVYFETFFQKGIYYKNSFYKQEIVNDRYVYKHSEKDYLIVNKTDNLYTLTIVTSNATANIEIEKTGEGTYSLTYPNNITYKGEYRGGYFFNEDGTPSFEPIFTDFDYNENIAINKQYSNNFIINIALGKNVRIRGDFEPLFLGILALVIGVLQLRFPKQMLIFGERWKYHNNLEDIELSDAYLSLNKIGSSFLLILALVLFITAI